MKRSSWPLRVALSALLLSAAPAFAQNTAELFATGQFGKVRERSGPGPQGEANFNLFVGRSDLNARISGVPRGATNCTQGPGRVQSARDWLASNAATTRVLMFNESHHVPAARVFVREVLPQLRALGFTHVGFEALKPDAGISKDLGPADGYYTVEPTFAALLREARAQGFMLFAYEAAAIAPANAGMFERIALREQGEADNLQRIVREAPEGSRFVVYAGWDHIAEIPRPAGDDKTQLWMAGRFKEQSGIDPLTIDLTGCSYPVASGSGEGARVRIDEGGQVHIDGQYRGAVDAQFILPAPEPADRAGFYRASLGRPVDLPRKLHPGGTTVIVEARPAGVPAGDVALDRVLLRPDERLPLYLPRGRFDLVAWRDDGTRLGEARVRVR